MKIEKLSPMLALMLFALTGCSGRLTGGGTFSGVTDEANPHEVFAHISFHDVAGAICNPTYDDEGFIVSGNTPDTVRGSFTFRETSPNDRSFTCEISDEPIEGVVANNFYGSGQAVDFEFQGNVTRYTGDWGISPPAYCAIIVLEGQFPGLTPQKGTTVIATGLSDADVNPLYLVGGSLNSGNLQYHLANVQGICSSNAGN